MNMKNNAKEILIDYLLANPGVDISRESIIQNTGISKSKKATKQLTGHLHLKMWMQELLMQPKLQQNI